MPSRGTVVLDQSYAGSAALPQRILNIVLFVTVLTSSIAFIEPSRTTA